MKIASAADVKAHLSAYLKTAETGPVVVTKNGRAVAVLVGVSNDDEVDQLLLAHSRKLHEILSAADQRLSSGRGLGHDEFWQQVDAAPKAAAVSRPARKKPTTSRKRACWSHCPQINLAAVRHFWPR